MQTVMIAIEGMHSYHILTEVFRQKFYAIVAKVYERQMREKK